MVHVKKILPFSLADIPENQVYLSQKNDLLGQILSAIGSGYQFKKQNSLTAVALLVNLVQSKEAHQYILKEELVNQVINDVTSVRNRSGMANSEMHETHLK